MVPLAEIQRDADKTAPLFVDVGGRHGRQCLNFRKATAAHFPGRVINQDLPGTLAVGLRYDHIVMMAENFYDKQQIQISLKLLSENFHIERIVFL